MKKLLARFLNWLLSHLQDPVTAVEVHEPVDVFGLLDASEDQVAIEVVTPFLALPTAIQFGVLEEMVKRDILATTDVVYLNTLREGVPEIPDGTKVDSLATDGGVVKIERNMEDWRYKAVLARVQDFLDSGDWREPLQEPEVDPTHGLYIARDPGEGREPRLSGSKAKEQAQALVDFKKRNAPTTPTPVEIPEAFGGTAVKQDINALDAALKK